jgi:hypothetical protein
MSWRARRRVSYYAKCGCGRTYTRRQWKALENLGVMHLPADEYGPESNVEMRNCACGSTLAVEKGPRVQGDMGTLSKLKWALGFKKAARDPGYKKGQIRPLDDNAQRRAAATLFLRKFPGAKVEGVRKIGGKWRVRGRERGGREVRVLFSPRQLMQSIKGRRAEKGYPKRARKGVRRK